MSLLRRAEKCFANQQVHKSLNALVPPRDEGRSIQEHTWNLRDADKRREEGTPIKEGLGKAYLIALIQLQQSLPLMATW